MTAEMQAVLANVFRHWEVARSVAHPGKCTMLRGKTPEQGLALNAIVLEPSIKLRGVTPRLLEHEGEGVWGNHLVGLFPQEVRVL